MIDFTSQSWTTTLWQLYKRCTCKRKQLTLFTRHVSVRNWASYNCSSSILKCSQVTGQNLSLSALNKALQNYLFKRQPNHGAESIMWFARHLIRALLKLNKIQSTYLSSNLKMLQPKTYYNRIPDMWRFTRFLFNDGKWWPHLDKIARFLFTKSTSISL